MKLVDTHCHIHEAGREVGGASSVASMWQKGGKTNPDELISNAVVEGVEAMICVGTTVEDSEQAVQFARTRPNCFASIGIHPHEAKDYVNPSGKLQKFSNLIVGDKIVAIGECGLDYYYNNSPKEDQKMVFRAQIELALEYDLPLIFHVRDAFDDFFAIVDDYKGIRGVVHSFSSTRAVLKRIISRDLYVGLNGIMTFTKDNEQLEAAKAVPPDRLVLETDAPFLTPTPYRGTMCEPRHVVVTAEFLANLRGEKLSQLTAATTANARRLFKFDDESIVKPRSIS